MISSLDAVRAINRERGDAVVVSAMTPNRRWDSVTENRDLDLPIFGAMGKASSVALGIALAQPDRKIVILDGDGGLLMNLGTLVTIAGTAPENLVHFVFEDGAYFTTGGQPVPGAGKFDLASMAQGAGFAASYKFDDLEDFASDLPRIMNEKGPVFVCLKVNHPDEIPEFYMGNTGEAMKRLASNLSAVPE
ncbi:MAG: thiamine pyrophosphate-binding protein [Chloroflexi bacterium]|nr:thiamine pyrophosphate-binding protein [Chloroflexota bacterium]